MSQPRAKFARVLSIDGGGIRGIVPATILVTLETKLQRATGNPNARIADFFDVVAGTSTGGIMTCALLVTDKQTGRPRYSAPDVFNIYYQQGAKIFEKKLLHTVDTIGGLTGTKYSTSNLESIVEQNVGDAKLSELAKPTVIATYDLEKSRAYFFKSHAAIKDPKRDFSVRDVALSTSAAPTYFEPHQAKNFAGTTYTFIDGGVTSNNPALCGLVEATQMFNITQHECIVLSLGTGVSPKGYTYKEAKGWGPVSWIQPLINTILIGGVSEVVNYELREIFCGPCASQYIRIQPNLEGSGADSDMDNASQSNRDALKAVGDKAAQEYDRQLDAFVQLLLATV